MYIWLSQMKTLSRSWSFSSGLKLDLVVWKSWGQWPREIYSKGLDQEEMWKVSDTKSRREANWGDGQIRLDDKLSWYANLVGSPVEMVAMLDDKWANWTNDEWKSRMANLEQGHQLLVIVKLARCEFSVVDLVLNCRWKFQWSIWRINQRVKGNLTSWR